MKPIKIAASVIALELLTAAAPLTLFGPNSGCTKCNEPPHIEQGDRFLFTVGQPRSGPPGPDNHNCGPVRLAAGSTFIVTAGDVFDDPNSCVNVRMAERMPSPEAFGPTFTSCEPLSRWELGLSCNGPASDQCNDVRVTYGIFDASNQLARDPNLVTTGQLILDWGTCQTGCSTDTYDLEIRFLENSQTQ